MSRRVQMDSMGSRRVEGFGPRTLAVLGLVALAATACFWVAPRHGWRRDHGPVVPHDSFPADCGLCHVTGTWNTLRADFAFDHEKETGVPLKGAHKDAECLLCHNDRGPVAEFARKGCAGCHVDVHRGHQGKDCAACHDEQDWIPHDQISMHNRTRFPLIGAHAATACWRCHPGAQTGNFDRADPDCLVCHRGDLAKATSPDHEALGWNHNCEHCHLPTDWKAVHFPHPSTFPLVGGHDRACSACHTGGTFKGLSTACASCHQSDYDATTDPAHAAAGFSTSCEQCHTVYGWRPSNFAHTIWPLTGRHKTASCKACHGNGVYKGTPTACVACHQQQYDATTNPNHRSAGFPTTCEQCHNTNGWGGGNFVHKFPIIGPHKNFNCQDCHVNPGNWGAYSCTHCHAHNQQKMADVHKGKKGYVWTSTACVSCHPNGKK